MKTVVQRFNAFRGLRSSEMDCKIASTSNRARSGTCAARVPVPSRVLRPVRRACAALLPARPTLHASAISTLSRNGRAIDDGVALLVSGKESLRTPPEQRRAAPKKRMKKRIS